VDANVVSWIPHALKEAVRKTVTEKVWVEEQMNDVLQTVLAHSPNFKVLQNK
jgi:hypothetical protein